MIAPNVGTYHLMPEDKTPIDTFGGHSLIVDYLGRVVGEHAYSGGSSWVAGTIDVTPFAISAPMRNGATG